MIGLGLSLWRSGGGQNPADWPELKLWLKFNEATGSVINDYSASPISGMTIASTGGHNPWVVSGMFQGQAAINNTPASMAYTARPNFNKLADPGNKAILIEYYGVRNGNYGADVSRFPFQISNYQGSINGYGLRIRRSGGMHKVEFVAGGSSNLNASNASGNTTDFPDGTLAHAATWIAGNGTNVAGSAVNGTIQNVNMSAIPGAINIDATDLPDRYMRIVTLGSSPLGTDSYPGNYAMIRVWHFDTLPANLSDVIAEMNASPLTLPTLLKKP